MPRLASEIGLNACDCRRKSLALSADGELSGPVSCSETDRDDEEDDDEDEAGRIQTREPLLDAKYFFGGYVGSVSGNAVINESARVRVVADNGAP